LTNPTLEVKIHLVALGLSRYIVVKAEVSYLWRREGVRGLYGEYVSPRLLRW
jgi:hypothetical protein